MWIKHVHPVSGAVKAINLDNIIEMVQEINPPRFLADAEFNILFRTVGDQKIVWEFNSHELANQKFDEIITKMGVSDKQLAAAAKKKGPGRPKKNPDPVEAVSFEVPEEL
jgi:hypothetical protein